MNWKDFFELKLERGVGFLRQFNFVWQDEERPAAAHPACPHGCRRPICPLQKSL
jgi:hypothetical protein